MEPGGLTKKSRGFHPLRDEGSSLISRTYPSQESPRGLPLPQHLAALHRGQPNKVGIRYEATALDVMYHGVPLGVATVSGFEQPAHNSRLVQTHVAVDRFNVLQADALNLVRDAAINDRVDLRLTGNVAAKILLLGISTPRVQVIRLFRSKSA
ncbi:hypothetical protein ZIOFF_028060 [Zingiber officinale]|uniref:Late embryogenesis abundant protein LEA-2 subgroup domain-containing protein n=1 Tax=Zingiber officinale TaxID=94328 RepID=A0A8J5GP67_ZINOF|nr:hypothetical protein ZIOFF_028060 [Zingiber officinale]